MKKLSLAFLSLVLVLSPLPVTQAADFPDVPSSHPNSTAVNFLHDRGVINGYEDGTYKPDRSVTRAEFLKIILLSSGHPVMSGDLDRQAFPDVPMTAWYFGLVNRGLALGVISGYPDGTFQPDRTVSRVEALKIMLRANNITEAVLPTSGSNFSDVAEGLWYTSYARYALTAHLFDGSQLRANEMMNRGQVAEMVYRFYLYRSDLLPTASLPTSTPTPSIPSATPSSPSPSASPTVVASTGFQVTTASMLAPSPASYSGACPAMAPISFVGIVNTNGQAGNIAYRWESVSGSVTSFQVVGIPAGQSSVALHWNPNWDASVHTGYRLHVLNNADGSNFADSGYEGFAIDCTSGGTSSTTPPPASGSLVVTSATLSNSGTSSYSAPCSIPTQVSFKGGVGTNGQAGTMTFHYESSTGYRSADETYTFAAGISSVGVSVIHHTFVLPTPGTDNAGNMQVVITSPNFFRSTAANYSMNCASSHIPTVHHVASASFTAQQPGVRDGDWVCGRANNFTLRGRLTMSTPASGGSIAYNWLFNTGETSSTQTITYDPATGSTINLPEYIWSIPSSVDPNHYTAWLNVLTPNALVSPSWSIDKPRCVSL